MRVVILLLFILLTATCMVAYFTFSFARVFYADSNAIRLNPLGLSNFVVVPTHISPDKKRVVFFGDSRAENWTTPTLLTGWEFVNRGIGGQTTAQVLGRFSAHITPLQPQVIVLQVGVNDLRTIPIFPDKRAEIVANCVSNIQAILKAADESGATVILTTIFPVGNASVERSLFYWSDDIADAVKEVNSLLRPMASERVIVLDADPILLDASGHVRSDYMDDTLHLNGAGYAALNQRLGQILADLPQ
ncbi:MAG: SGNH/GDSL hydrolase family protein [Anaerolineaceae bacterium]|nr:SGNH/GDSL hydrolase family protein [Anaerolineaceae bacterium]